MSIDTCCRGDAGGGGFFPGIFEGFGSFGTGSMSSETRFRVMVAGRSIYVEK